MIGALTTASPSMRVPWRAPRARRLRDRDALAMLMDRGRRRSTVCAFGEVNGARGGRAEVADAPFLGAHTTTSRGDEDVELEKDFMAILRKHYGNAKLLSLDLSESSRNARSATVPSDPQVCGFQNTYGCSLTMRYVLGEEIARGAFGKVRTATDLVHGDEVAIKTMKKNKLSQDSYVAESVKAEIDLLGIVQGCSGVIELFDVQEDARDLHVVTELLRGGTLAEAMQDGKMEGNEGAVKAVARQILAMLQDIHARGVVHRDVKPKNFMYDCEDHDAARLIGLDFGSASSIPEEGLLTASIGTPTYMAPEVADQKKRGYTEKCDLWSVGVIVYEALTGGRVPFQQIWDEVARTNAAESGLVSVQSILDTLAAIDYALNAYDCDAMELLFPPGTIPTADSLSPELRDFLARLLCPENKRMSATEALSHPWLALP